MTKATLTELLLASTTILLSAAYLICLNQQASQGKHNDYSVLVAILFIPAIISAFTLLAHSIWAKKVFLSTGVLFAIICFFINLSYSIFCCLLLSKAGFKFNDIIKVLPYLLPLGYPILLTVGHLVLKKRNNS
jgi:hypothetical protein